MYAGCRYNSDVEVQRPFWGLKFAIWGLFWGVKDFDEDFLGVSKKGVIFLCKKKGNWTLFESNN